MLKFLSWEDGIGEDAQGRWNCVPRSQVPFVERRAAEVAGEW